MEKIHDALGVLACLLALVIWLCPACKVAQELQ